MANGQELAQYYVQIIPSARGIGGQIVSEVEKDDPGGKIGNSISTKIRRAITGLGIGTLITKTITDSLSAGGKLEQSIGGIEQIFGSGSKATELLKQNAQEAFSYAQVNANDYMQQITSFSAKLMQGLGGDTDATVKYADMAIRQMSDNANTFGTDISMLQNAYQGFARNNYTMLDNLKLGYSGTASEMARLINDSGVLGKNVKVTANNVNSVSFDKVIEAIQVVQDNMNITGKTVQEAFSTMEGSMSAFKSAFTNLLADIAIGEDATTAMKGVASSAVAVVKNFGKATLNIVKGLPSALVTMIEELTPTIIDGAVTLMNNLSANLENGIPTLIDSVSNRLTSLISGVDSTAFFEAGGKLVISLGNGLLKSIPNIINLAKNLLKAMGDNIIKNLPIIVKVGTDVVVSLVNGIVSAIPTLISEIFNLTTNMKESLTNVNWKQVGSDILNYVVSGISSMVSNLLNVMANVAKSAAEKITSTNWWQTGSEIITKLVSGITSKVSGLINTIKDIATNIWNVFTGKNWNEIGANISQGVANGINQNSGVAIGAAKALANGTYNSVRGLLQIQSPSKLFEEVGKYVDLGFAKGIQDNMTSIENAMSMVDALDPKGLAKDVSTSETTNNQNTYNFYVQAHDTDSVVNEIRSILINEIQSGKAVYNV